MASAVAVGPALPAPVKHAFHNNVRSRQPFDARLLTKKLEAAALERDVALLRRRKAEPTRKPEIMKTGSYVPQHAAKQFAATTTPVNKDTAETLTRRAQSKQQAQQKRSEPTLTVPKWTADGKPCVNPKRVVAVLSMGVSESEAAALPPPRSKGDLVKPAEANNARVESGSSQDKAKQPERKLSTRGYKPGDAANRRSALISTKHGSMTTYERVELRSTQKSLVGVLEYRSRGHREDDMPYDDFDLRTHDEDEQPQGFQRPRLQPHDRPDWSQQSQCGGDDDDTRQLLTVPVLDRKGRARNWAQPRSSSHGKQVGEDAVWRGIRPKILRQKSEGDTPENLISSAVQKIKKVERNKRRESLIGFFKRP